MDGEIEGGGALSGGPQIEGGGTPAAPGPAGTDTPAAAPMPGESPGERIYEVQVRGETIQVPESELLKGYSRHEDYTRSTQELGEAKRQLQPYMELADYLQGNPKVVEALEKALQEEGIAGQSAPQVPDPRYSQMEDRLMDTEYRLEAMQFQAKFPTANVQQVTEFAISQGIPSLAAAYKVMAYDQTVQGRAQMLSQNVAQKQGAATEQQYGSQPPPTQEVDVTGMSLEDRIRVGIKKYGPLTT
jgi:hypothetical protein